MKTQPRTIIQTTKYNASCNHCVTLEDDYCVPFLKSKFLILTLCHIFYLPTNSVIFGEYDFVSSVLGIKLRN